MIFFTPSTARGRLESSSLLCLSSFSFLDHHDPARTGFGALRVFNEYQLQPGAGLPAHRYANMEVLTLVLDGVLECETDTACLIPAGSAHWLGAGHAQTKTLRNPQHDACTRFLHLWIQPNVVNAAPQSALGHLDCGQPQQCIAAPVGEAAALHWRQDARLHWHRAKPGTWLDIAPSPARRHWLHLISGQLQVADHPLASGDAIGLVSPQTSLRLHIGTEGAQFLLLDLP